MADPRIRQIKIKTGVVKRIAKEKVVYEKEAELQRNRIQRIKDEGQDEHNIRKQEEVLQESLMMVPDCQRRLQKAFTDLKNTLDTEQDLKEHEDYLAAEKVLQEAEAQLPDNIIMSSNQNFYNYKNQLTFQTSFPPPTYIPPPPVPPKFFIPPMIPQTTLNTPQTSDQDYIKNFESRVICTKKPIKLKVPSISEVRLELTGLIALLNELKDKEKILLEKVNTATESQWQAILKQVESNKVKIAEILSKINDQYLDTLRKVIAKRTSKRSRLKRIRMEKKREKEEWIKECKEKSRKIDENLQKIKNEIDKKKQEEEAKLQADSILKEVLRKKHDAKKCLVKLDALMKLRKARQNTAKGRGEKVSESEAAAFNKNIEKLKSLWSQKLTIYENEESNLRVKLKEKISEQPDTLNTSEKEVIANLSKWRECLFGDRDALPQYDFQGDISRFVAVRSEWDQFISNEGTSLPMGWVVPVGKL